MAEINLKKDAVSAETDRVKAEAEQMCPACEHMLWVSFYFDGFGFGEKDGPRTNILKLFNAAYDKKNKNMRRFYYPGLGADFDPEAGVLREVLKDKATDTVSEKAGDKLKEQTVDKVKEKAQKAAEDAWKQSGKISDPTFGKRVSDTFDTLVGKTKDGLGDARKRIERAIEARAEFRERERRCVPRYIEARTASGDEHAFTREPFVRIDDRRFRYAERIGHHPDRRHARAGHQRAARDPRAQRIHDGFHARARRRGRSGNRGGMAHGEQ